MLPDGKHVLVAEDERGLALRSFPELKVSTRVLDHAYGVKHVSVSPDARNFAAVDHENHLRILDGRTLQPLILLKDNGSPHPLDVVQFAPSGDFLIGVQNDRIIIWGARELFEQPEK